MHAQLLSVPAGDALDMVAQLANRGLMVFLVASPGGVTMPATMPALAPTVPASGPQIVAPAFTGHNVKETLLACVESKCGRGCRRSYLNNFNSTINLFAEDFGDRALHTITAEEIERWLANPAWNNETRRGYLSKVRTFFSFAVKRRWLARNVAFDVDMPMPSNKPPGILPVADAAALMKACRDEDRAFLPWLAVQLFAGLRVCEACFLTPADINGEFITIGADKAKTRRRRLVPINPTLRAWLDAAGPIDSVNWRKRVVNVRKAARVRIPKNALRHSFCSYSVPIHGAALTASWAGHSEQVLFNHYRELVSEADAKAFWEIRP